MWQWYLANISPFIPSWVWLIILGFVAVATLTWKAHGIWNRFTSMEKSVEEYGGLTKTLQRIDKHLTALLSHFLAKKEIDSALLRSDSPLTVTELGEQLLTDSSFINVYQSIEQKFINFVDSMEPKTLFDIENHSVRAVFTLLGEQEMIPFKNYLYEHPQLKVEGATDSTVTNNELMTTAGVYVRDRMMENDELMRKWGLRE